MYICKNVLTKSLMEPAEIKLAIDTIQMLTKLLYFVAALTFSIGVWSTRLWFTQRQQQKDIDFLKNSNEKLGAEINALKIQSAVSEQIFKRMSDDISDIKKGLSALIDKYVNR